ncbi:adenosinetriphosphatase [Capronia coronata CBS 617.96]|uniref:Adenosinetriphosphatase n=1 Tax=Capronia coronata CBS 617.96 TaxID=1182541 RepID=W9YYD7_9EURO|nr:adenosinetriphosphatase [Capronia coronata CBS 617.96]EXJ94710.1 adenosinetriphosphatase [Capronia coronata CBS 617.96]
MMRSKLSSSMQKTYDECYLQCSTAIFFEGQGNEPEALRSWKSALDQINYFRAYKLPSNYSPKSETERALYDSLKELEMQCKERVDLLEALKRSRQDVERDSQGEERLDHGGRRRLEKSKSAAETPLDKPGSWLGDHTIPPMQMSELPSATPSMASRPPLGTARSSDAAGKDSSSRARYSPFTAPPTLAVPTNKVSRSPSPDNAGRKTMRTTLRSEKKGFRNYRSAPNRDRMPETLKAAGLAWEAQPRRGSQISNRPDSDPTIEARLSATAARRSLDQDATARYEEQRKSNSSTLGVPDFLPQQVWRDISNPGHGQPSLKRSMDNLKLSSESVPNLIDLEPEPDRPPPPPPHTSSPAPVAARVGMTSPTVTLKPPDLSYRKEYPTRTVKPAQTLSNSLLDKAYPRTSSNNTVPGMSRKPVGKPRTAIETRGRSPAKRDDNTDSDDDTPRGVVERTRRPRAGRTQSATTITPPSTDVESTEDDGSISAEGKRIAEILQRLPKGLDENAAKQILNEIVVKGDEVHWEDVAGLEAAKKALKEAVVYPFLRPDLFMGLREPARGMLLFGPPGTGKTMLARAVATESKSTFFAISASSLTSKWHGESEKLVRALFAMAKALAPSIIFVDEIDSLLSTRSGASEHEASRRSKTEFLIQWSDLQRAAAGKDTTIGDPSRVLVLAATNCPWDIDEAARRRFVRRQYIPLPEAETRETQIRTLLGHQKHELGDEDIKRLVELTDGYSGSDITALAKDAAMGPLRNLGEALLYTPKEQIRPIRMEDFEASLINIRPSVSKKGLEEFEKWAREFGERGG